MKEFRLQDLIDIPMIQKIQDKLNAIYPFPFAIVDLDGTILTSSEPQEVCRLFHQKTHGDEKSCLRLEKKLYSKELQQFQPRHCFCPHGLTELFIPVSTAEYHLGYILSGQYFDREPDLEYYRFTAGQKGYDVENYLEAIGKVPVFSGSQIRQYQDLFQGFASLLADICSIRIAQAVAGREIEEKEKRYTEVLDFSMDGFWEIDPDGIIIRANESACRMSGYSQEEMTGMPIMLLEVNANSDAISQRISRILEGHHECFETVHRRKNGEHHHVEVSAQYMPHYGGRIYCFIHDITVRKIITEELEKNQNRFSQVTENTGVGIWELNSEGVFTYISDNALAILGYRPEEVIGRLFFYNFFVEQEREALKTMIFRIMHEKSTFTSLILKSIRKDYVPIILEAAGSPILDEQGNLAGYRGTVVDVTMREKALQELRVSEERFRQITSTMSDICFSCTGKKPHDYRLDWIFGATEQITGYTISELYDLQCWGKLVISEDFPLFMEQVLMVPPGNSGKCQLRLKHKNGELIWIETSVVSSIDGEHSDNHRIFGGIINITERKKIEEKITETNRNVIRAQKIAHIGSWENHLSTGELTWSEEMYHILGFPPGVPFNITEVIGIFPEEELVRFRKSVDETVRNGVPYSQDYRIVRPDGVTRYIHDEGEVAYDEQGNPHVFFGTTQDITDRKLGELELIATRDLAEENDRLKSAFLNNMSHEIRTPMNAIMGFSELLMESDDESKEKYCRIINRSATQLLALIDDVIRLSRLQSEKMPVNLSVFSPVDLVNAVVQIFSLPDQLKNVKLKVRVPAKHNRLMIRSDQEKIHQILSNLVSNALKYTKTGTVETGFLYLNQAIEFFVEDSGIGIPKHELPRIFEKFFRGDEVISAAIGGTGLGLNIARELVELLGGTIGVNSEQGKGSRFYFILPVEWVEMQPESVKEGTVQATEMNELVILVAEDNHENYLLLEVLLKPMVKRIDHAVNGVEVLDMVATNHYDLVLMDIKMPVMSGIEATTLLKEKYPELPVIAQTAYAQPEEKESALAAGCNAYIVKPIRKEVLLNLIKKFALNKV
jgi:PAS domain S-box-containing protein